MTEKTKPYSDIEAQDPASVMKSYSSDIAAAGILALVIFAVIGFLCTCAGAIYAGILIFRHFLGA